MISKPVSTIRAGIDFGSALIELGRLAIRDRIIYFEYERSIVERGLEISPLRLPLQPGLKSFDAALFFSERMAERILKCLSEEQVL